MEGDITFIYKTVRNLYYNNLISQLSKLKVHLSIVFYEKRLYRI